MGSKMYIADRRIRKDSSGALAKFKATILGMIFFNHMIGRSLINSPYMQSCKEKDAELEKICSQVEIGLCTRAWLIG